MTHSLLLLSSALEKVYLQFTVILRLYQISLTSPGCFVTRYMSLCILLFVSQPVFDDEHDTQENMNRKANTSHVHGKRSNLPILVSFPAFNKPAYTP